MNQAKQATAKDQRAFFLSVLTLEYGIRSNQAALAWLTSAIERVKAGNFTLTDLVQS